MVGLGEPSQVGGFTYWVESRPMEQGRSVLLCKGANDSFELPSPWSARSRVHEYGGGAYLATEDGVFFVDDANQQVWRWMPTQGSVEPITGPSDPPRSVRWADFVPFEDGRWLIGIRETHVFQKGEDPGQVLNELVALDSNGSGTQRVLFNGSDFVSSPEISPDGRQISWITWDHPHMPWDSSRLWLASIGPGAVIADAKVVAGGPGVSVCQPCFDPAGQLHFISDQTGWWNLYRLDLSGATPLAPMAAEFASPQWVFGDRRYCFLGDGSILASCGSVGIDRLVLIQGGECHDLETPEWLAFSHLKGIGREAVMLAGGPREPSSVLRVELSSQKTLRSEILASAFDPTLGGSVNPALWSIPQAIEFEGYGGIMAHALYYPAHSLQCSPEDQELPPLVIVSHGGPTSAFRAILDLAGVQYFTTRGIAVVQVNYTGSSGYGRHYRDALSGLWGVADVHDCLAAAASLAGRGEIDGDRLFIRGSSAGGYTTLCALSFTDGFTAGASYYGIGDLGALAKSTHKFEAHYLDSLIGPWPDSAPLYRQRSPAFHTERLRTPVALFQGDQDAVVPPSQAKTMADALASRGIEHVLLIFEGEGHGFRKAETKRRCLEAELGLYGRLGGFTTNH